MGNTGGSMNAGNRQSGVIYYKYFAQAIFNNPEGPMEDDKLLLGRRNQYDLEPTEATDKPLLVHAMNQQSVEWFRCLIEKCDPTVRWQDKKREMTLEEALLRAPRRTEELNKIYDMYRSKMQQLEAGPKTDTTAAGDGEAGKTYAAEMALLGISVVAGVGLFVAGVVIAGPTAVSGLPLAGVGAQMWEAIREWNASFNASQHTDELKQRFNDAGKLLGQMLTQLNKQIEDAQKAAQNNPEVDRQVVDDDRIALLKKMLLDDAKEMAKLQRSKKSRRQKEKKVKKMLRRLHDYDQQLQSKGQLTDIQTFLEKMIAQQIRMHEDQKREYRKTMDMMLQHQQRSSSMEPVGPTTVADTTQSSTAAGNASAPEDRTMDPDDEEKSDEISGGENRGSGGQNNDT